MFDREAFVAVVLLLSHHLLVRFSIVLFLPFSLSLSLFLSFTLNFSSWFLFVYFFFLLFFLLLLSFSIRLDSHL